MKLKHVLFTLAIGVISTSTFAQDNNTDAHNVSVTIPEVALLDLEASAGTSISLAPTAPTEAGLAADFSAAQDNSIWINYSSIIGSTTEPSRNVSVQITSGTLPGGVALRVTPSTDAGQGEGTMGTVGTSAITLGTSAQNVVTGIGSAYTGDGVSKGHNLTYKLDKLPGAFGRLDFDQSSTLVISYTLSDS